MPILARPLPATIRQWPWPLLLVWSCLLLLPAGRSVELPTAVMAVAAGVLWYRGGIDPLAERFRLFTFAFLAVWIPMLLSLPDAYVPTEATRVTLLYLRFYFAGLFIIWAIDTPERWNLLLCLIGWLLLFWVGDALIQFLIGHDLFGYPLARRLNGIFGRHLRLGNVVAILSPFLLGWALTRLPRWLAALAFAVLVFVLLASGSRASWVMFGVVLFTYAVVFLRTHRERALLLMGLGLTAALAIGIGAYQLSPPIAKRVDTTLLLFSGDENKIDTALSRRLPIWRTAVAMAAENPVNGVGVRDFRHAYDRYASSTDYFIQREQTPTHPHQYVLEMAAESGGIGLAGLVLLYLLLLRRWRDATPAQRRLAIPAAAALLAVWFPLNTHHAFYSSFMGQMVWWVTALYFAVSGIREPGDETR